MKVAVPDVCMSDSFDHFDFVNGSFTLYVGEKR